MRTRRLEGDGDADPAARTTVVDEGGALPPVVEEEEVVPPPRRPRPPLLWPWLLLLLLLVAVGLAAAYFLTRDDGNDSKPAAGAAATVPNVVGMKQDEAQRRLSERGLDSRVVRRASNVPRGTVFVQKPAAGTKLARGAQVQLTVSAVSLTNVPNVVGLKSAAAIKKLEAAGLHSEVSSVAATKPAGTVLSQTPAADKRVGKGSTVTLKVSKGTAAVPDVVGQQAADARAAVGAAGFKTSVFEVPSAESKGTVVAQHPAAGTKAARGSQVRINVSTGPEGATTGGTTTTSAPAAVKVPNVVGLQQGAAQRRLNQAGLNARVLYVASQARSGEVVSQAPAAGSSVERGARVALRVSLGPNQTGTTLVPKVVGDDQQTATSELEGAGFTVQVIQTPVSDPSQAGLVVDQQPGGGSRAPNGSQVTVYVGQSS